MGSVLGSGIEAHFSPGLNALNKRRKKQVAPLYAFSFTMQSESGPGVHNMWKREENYTGEEEEKKKRQDE